jgi:hypothetical protein
MRRREFVTLLSGTARGLAARGARAAADNADDRISSPTSRDEGRGYLPDFQQGLADARPVDVPPKKLTSAGLLPFPNSFGYGLILRSGIIAGAKWPILTPSLRS